MIDGGPGQWGQADGEPSGGVPDGAPDEDVAAPPGWPELGPTYADDLVPPAPPPPPDPPPPVVVAGPVAARREPTITAPGGVPVAPGPALPTEQGAEATIPETLSEPDALDLTAAPNSGRHAATHLGTNLVAPPPAEWGWRGVVHRATGGLVRLSPDADELTYRDDVATIRQTTWSRCVNIVVANPKGGTGKTPTALILGGSLAYGRGGYVAVWEATEAAGSLTRRAEGAPAKGLAELLGDASRVRSAGELGAYTAPQTSYADVIGSVGDRPALTAADVLALRRVLDTHYRVVVTDTANNPRHEVFATVMRTADAAVLPCLVSLDALVGVQTTLATMRELGDDVATEGGLLSRVVVVLGHDGGPENPAVVAAVRDGLAALDVSAVIEVPFDPAIRLGSEIPLRSLSRASRRAWTAVTAAVVRALQSAPTDVDLVARVLDLTEVVQPPR